MPAATWRVNSAACAEWAANHAYSLGDRCVCTSGYATTARRKYVWECTVAGTSHATTQPTWPDGPVGGTLTDGGVTWTCRLPNDGDWLNATCYLGYIMSSSTPIAAGDFIYIHNAHSESKNWGTYNLYGSGSGTVPFFILCVNKDSSDALSTGAVVHNNVTTSLMYLLGCVYSYGVQYKGRMSVGSASVSASWYVEGNGAGVACLYQTTANPLYVGYGGGPCRLVVQNSDIYLTAQSMIQAYTGGDGYFEWNYGTLQGGALSRLLNTGQFEFIARISNVDLTAIGTGATNYLVKLDNLYCDFDYLISRCKLPGSSFTLWEGDDVNIWKGRVRIHHCSSANKYYDFCERDSFGTTEDETTIVRTGGANDGTTGQAWKMISSNRCVDGYYGTVSPPINAWNDYTTEKTYTVEGIWDSATNIQNDEVWMELEYPADNTSGLGKLSRAKCAILGTPANVTTSAATWTTTGLTNPQAFKLQATVTAGKKGPIAAKVVLAKPSTTIYIDPLITVS